MTGRCQVPKKKHVDVLGIGTLCEIQVPGEDVLPGIIIGIQITQEGVRYRIAWWDDRIRRDEWMEEFEIKVKPSEARHLKIGFTDE